MVSGERKAKAAVGEKGERRGRYGEWRGRGMQRVGRQIISYMGLAGGRGEGRGYAM